MTTPSNALTVLPGGQDNTEDLQDLEVTAEGLRLYIAAYLKEEWPSDPDITPDVILENKAFSRTLKICKDAYELQVQQINQERAKKRRALEEAKQERLAEKAKKMEANLRAKLGLPPVLTQEQIRAKAQAIQAEVTAKPAPNSGVESPAVQERSHQEYLDKLRHQLSQSLPEIVFEGSEEAIVFRQVLKSCIQPYQAKLREQGLDADYRAELIRLQAQIQSIFPMADKAVMEWWGLDLKTFYRDHNNELFDDVVDSISDDPRFTEMIKWMGKCPTMEQIKAEAEAKAAALAEAKAKEEAEIARRTELKGNLMARMAEVAGGVKDNHNLQATSLAKQYGHLPDIKAMFTARAVFQMTKKGGKHESSAKFYAECAGVPMEEIIAQAAAIDAQEQHPSTPKPNSVASPVTDKEAARKARETARKARQAARQKADDDARPEPNQGSGDPRNWKKPNSKKSDKK